MLDPPPHMCPDVIILQYIVLLNQCCCHVKLSNVKILEDMMIHVCFFFFFTLGCVSLDMEPAGQAVYPGVFGSAAPGEGLHFADCKTPAPAGSGPAGAERREGESRRQDQPRPTRTSVCGPQQTARHQSRRTGVSGPHHFHITSPSLQPRL